MIPIVSVDTITKIFETCKIIAVAGLSPKENRPSNQVARYLQKVGYKIVPVNPGQSEILGERCYPDLVSIPFSVDIVDIFRRSDQVEPIVRDAIKIGAAVVWMQQGVIHQIAARAAGQAGLQVIMDRCIKIDHMQYGTKNNKS